MEKNRLDTLIRNSRRAMAEIGKSLEISDQQSINGTLLEAEESLETANLHEIKAHMDRVEGAANRITAAMLTMA